ncbi:MAG TPA: tripartite tricarboxylate transporter substrate binding protein [Burkholderiales bacterium]|nr:tripartite tricarboxylate transporter substrate binding protein [Burkholderiales bacterium]
MPGTSTRWVWVYGLIVAALTAQAQELRFPNRPVRVIVGIAPGGGMDTISRALAQKLGDNLGQTVIVDNRPGAGGNIAMEMASSSAADGHNLLIISATSVIHPILYKARFDVLRDFAPVSQISAQGYVVAVHPSVPARNILELVQHLKANPGKLNYASSGIGSPIHLTGELFTALSGTRMTHVPYKGIGPAYADLIAGNIEMSFPAIVSSLPHIRAGKLRALAVTLPKRSNVVPELPTIVEAGVPGVVVVNWYGVLVPLATPQTIIERLSQGVASAMSQPEVVKRLLADGSESATSTPDQFRAHIAEERDKWTRVIRNANIRVQ